MIIRCNNSYFKIKFKLVESKKSSETIKKTNSIDRVWIPIDRMHHDYGVVYLVFYFYNAV